MFKHFTFTAWRLPYSPLEETDDNRIATLGYMRAAYNIMWFWTRDHSRFKKQNLSIDQQKSLEGDLILSKVQTSDL
jgi:hypothetical protein